MIGTTAVDDGSGSLLGQGISDYDMPLLVAVLLMASLGVVVVTSASISIADRLFEQPLYYFWRQLLAVIIGFSLAFVAMKIPLRFWYRTGPLLLLLAIVLLALVFIPGVGREVKGSIRWIGLGPVSLQASEPAKLCVIIYLARYLVRHGHEFGNAFFGFLKPLGLLTVFAGLLLLEPDYGATVVLFVAALGMVFLAGVPVLRFIGWGLVAVFALGTVAVLAPYRMQRLTAFIDPWADPYHSGFQLTQALIAFGRGEWFGVGLGSSIQKLFYLPEVHTDFIFAVSAEEFGLLGTVTIIGLFAFIFWRAMYIGSQAERMGQRFSANLSHGLGLLIGVQAFFNIGVNMGVLPTKGLTLPLISYGSNSMVVTCIAIGLLLRIAYESARSRKSGKAAAYAS